MKASTVGYLLLFIFGLVALWGALDEWYESKNREPVPDKARKDGTL